MYSKLILSYLLLIRLQCHGYLDEIFSYLKEEPVSNSLGPPLILTPLIKDGKIVEAQTASTVTFKGFKGITSYAAYLTVDEIHKSNLFFWFFPAKNDYANAPVVLWLQGGPGTPSMIGLFMENGPFFIKTKHGLKHRKYSWIEDHSVIYIDNPVGTGYSFTNEGGYATNQTIIGAHLYNAMLQFFQLFPNLQKNNFFISGESYAGKYAPALGYTIHKNNPNAKQKINLQGISIGNGFCEPVHQIDYGDYLYGIGIIDMNQREKFKQLQDDILKDVEAKQWQKATEGFHQLIGFNASLFKNITESDNCYNYLTTISYQDGMESVGKYIQRDDIRTAIHVGNATFYGESSVVQRYLWEEFMQSNTEWISELLDNYRILFYNGQLDIIVAYSLTVNFLQNLKFKAANEYKTAVRKSWYVDSQLAGYVKQAGNLYEVLVRNAGHLVPMDQPQWALDLITRFTRNKPYHVS